MFGRVGEELIVLAEWKDFGDSGGAGNEELTSRVSIPFVPLERSTDQYEVCLMSYLSRGANASKSAAPKADPRDVLQSFVLLTHFNLATHSRYLPPAMTFLRLLVIWQG